jgi:hypothetical protein
MAKVCRCEDLQASLEVLEIYCNFVWMFLMVEINHICIFYASFVILPVLDTFFSFTDPTAR